MSTSSQRIVAATTATLEWQGIDQYGEPGDPGTVTVSVVRSDGSVVLAAGTATLGSAANPRTVALTPTQTAQLDVLTAIWSSGGVALATTTHEVVGGVYATLAEIRAVEDSLAGTTDFTDVTLRRCRSEVEATIEQVTHQAFVPRFSVVEVPAGRPLRVVNLRSVRWSRIAPNDDVWVDTDPLWDPFGQFVNADARALVGVEHGLDAPPYDLKRAAMIAVRRQAGLSRSAVSSRALSYTTPQGEVQRFPTPGLGPWITGIPDVDEVIRRYVHADRPRAIRMTPTGLPTVFSSVV